MKKKQTGGFAVRIGYTEDGLLRVCKDIYPSALSDFNEIKKIFESSNYAIILEDKHCFEVYPHNGSDWIGDTFKWLNAYIEHESAKKKYIIHMINHDGTLVPRICGENISELRDELQAIGVEVLNVSKDCIIIYTKEYTNEEMNDRNLKDFHKGYNIESFFKKRKDLIPFIDRENLEEFGPYLEEKVFKLLSGGGKPKNRKTQRSSQSRRKTYTRRCKSHKKSRTQRKSTTKNIRK